MTNLYFVDDEPEPFTLEDFIAANEDASDPEDIAAVQLLRDGESVTLGGGAWATFVITRGRPAAGSEQTR